MKYIIYREVCPEGVARMYERSARDYAGNFLRTGNTAYQTLALKDAKEAQTLRKITETNQEINLTELLELGK